MSNFMTKTIVKLRAWGNSVGAIIPKSDLEKAHLRPDDHVEIIFKKKENPLKEVFGQLAKIKPRSKKSDLQILKEMDKEFETRYE